MPPSASRAASFTGFDWAPGSTVPDVTLIDRFWQHAYYGRFRRLFRGAVARLINRESRIVRGPLRGCRLFSRGGLAYRLGVYEQHVVDAVLRMLVEGDVVYDVGANEAFFSMLAASRVGLRGFVYAFEPEPSSAQLAARNLHENGMSQCAVVPLAVSDRNESVALFLDHSAEDASLIGDERRLMVQATTLDDFAATHRRPSLIKVDIEGAELSALQGAIALLRSDVPPAWIIELHNEEARRAVTDLLRQTGYQIQDLIASRRAPKMYPCHIAAMKPPHTALHAC